MTPAWAVPPWGCSPWDGEITGGIGSGYKTGALKSQMVLSREEPISPSRGFLPNGTGAHPRVPSSLDLPIHAASDVSAEAFF